MVSTRQMSTTVSSNGTGSVEDGPPRLTVTTRQSYNSFSTVASTRSQGASSKSEDTDKKWGIQKIFLLDLPVEILDNIFSYVGYKKVGQMRVVSKQMNQICSTILNSTFSKLQTQMLNRFQTVKAKMPRRESARRNHPLACECDIIETCYMRLSLLQMTFGKHIERKHCCFFPGGILDEVYNVLNYIRTTPKLERPYKVTDELFDLSTMAMEYFKEHIEPNLPEIAHFSKDFFDITSKSKQAFSLKTVSELADSSSPLPSPPQSNMVLRKGIRKIKQGMKMYNNQLTSLRNELRNCKRKSSEQGKQIAEQQKLLADQQKQTLEYANRLDENDKKNEEMSRKFSTLLQELNKCKTELQYWRSKSPATQICTSCGQKVASVAPEDYQALVNQGVKPEDINISVEDAEDADVDGVLTDIAVSNRTSTEFVFPDETTTAKLIALERGRGLKRHYDTIFNSASLTSIAAREVAAPAKDLNVGLQNATKPPDFSTNISTDDSGSSGPICGMDTRYSNNAQNSVSPSTSSCTASNATSLSSVSSEMKKARRVQNKGSRCNLSSKRNK